ncbi:type II toxin-antitoxin system RelE/ParE family toxin [Rhizobium sp. RU36D]|uniref:type II toxin-antitoxin system RelE/ParE family toxin n=1 Tax=Rhizobium sp. RU36D TaxID=1907415 RepID=UPI0009D7D8C2|nr:type II toxin-antitoxin system RelE/ParE family toxin [Rhizobium sp. RU36D]SMD07260.1 Plasmid stabilization system protein ParE [Rhizobium sp. RU36D]
MRKRRLVISLKALNDLLAIHNYISDFNPAAAKKMLRSINEKLDWMAKSGAIGAPRPFAPGLKAVPFRNYCIYFVVSETTMTVLRIRHGRQNVTPDDFTESED